MKFRVKILLALAVAASLFASCKDDDKKTEAFGPDIEEITIEPQGGKVKFNLNASGSWLASTDDPWVLITPANGTGTAECTIRIDSTVMNNMRVGAVVFSSEDGITKTIPVKQSGFAPEIIIEDEKQKTINIPDYEKKENAYFYVDVTANVPFKIDVGSAQWLKERKYNQDVSNAAKPRTTRIYFDWLTNVDPQEQLATIKFLPVDVPEEELARMDVVKVVQDAAPEIIPSRKGDSLVLVTLARLMNLDRQFNTSLSMEHWEDRVTLNKDGRVIKLELAYLANDEIFPYHIQYLTELEELYVWGGYGRFNFYPVLNDYVTKLKKLKVLKIEACFLGGVTEKLVEMKQLELLSLAHNNLLEIPAMLTPENFPNLRHLYLNTNQRRSGIFDLSNSHYEEIGLSGEFPEHLLRWDSLYTLTLGVNYFEGTIPTMENYKKWGDDPADEVAPGDELYGVPKVLPACTRLTINLNKFTGELPEWLLKHPNLCKWVPDIFIFNQNGNNSQGEIAKFTNIPAQLDCLEKPQD